jgi:hypothetical protein
MAAPTLDVIRDAIAAVIQAVPGTGAVHSYEVSGRTEDSFRIAYLADGSLNGWNIRRVATKEIYVNPAITQVTHLWRLRAFRAISGGGQSERDFDATIEAVRSKFRDDWTLGGLIINTRAEAAEGLQVDDSQPVMFAGVLCHGATCSLATVLHAGHPPRR